MGLLGNLSPGPFPDKPTSHEPYFSREAYVKMRNLMAGQPWGILGIDLLVAITQLTEACKSWLSSTPEINKRSGTLWLATRAWSDLAVLRGQSEWVNTAVTAVELQRAWDVFFAAGKERCQDSGRNRYNEARLDAQAVIGKTKNSLLTESERSLQEASNQRITKWVNTDLYPADGKWLDSDNRPLAVSKWLDAVLLLAEDPGDADTTPDPAAQIRQNLDSRERYHGDPAAATAPLLSRTTADEGAGCSIAWRRVEPLGDEAPAGPANIQSQAMVNRDRQLGPKKISSLTDDLTDDHWQLLDARMDHPEIPLWGAELPEMLGWSANHFENITKSLEADRPAGRVIRKFYDAYRPADKRHHN